MSDFEKSKEDWNKGERLIVTCSECGDQIHSKWDGQFVGCSCGKIYVDQTPYYCRIGGEPGKYSTHTKILYPKSENNREKKMMWGASDYKKETENE